MQRAMTYRAITGGQVVTVVMVVFGTIVGGTVMEWEDSDRRSGSSLNKHQDESHTRTESVNVAVCTKDRKRRNALRKSNAYLLLG